MEFTPIFDIAQSGYRGWGFVTVGPIFVALGIIFFFLHKILLKLGLRKTPEEPRHQKIFKFFFLGFSVFWTLSAFVGTYFEYMALKKSERQMVEGPVEGFRAGGKQGQKTESFTVQGVYFEYSDNRITSGFNHTSSKGGPVSGESYVRIGYVANGNSNVIVKLAIRNYQGPVKDYSRGFSFLDVWREMDKQVHSSQKPAFPHPIEEQLKITQNYSRYIFSFLAIYFLLHLLMVLPYYRSYLRITTVEHPPRNLPDFQLQSGTQGFNNLTARYDPEGIIWARPYGLETMEAPGMCVKMYLSRDKSRIIQSEIRISVVLVVCIVLFAVSGFQLLSAPLSASSNPEMRWFPYIIFPMLLLSFLVMTRRFRKKIDQALNLD